MSENKELVPANNDAAATIFARLQGLIGSAGNVPPNVQSIRESVSIGDARYEYEVKFSNSTTLAQNVPLGSLLRSSSSKCDRCDRALEFGVGTKHDAGRETWCTWSCWYCKTCYRNKEDLYAHRKQKRHHYCFWPNCESTYARDFQSNSAVKSHIENDHWAVDYPERDEKERYR